MIDRRWRAAAWTLLAAALAAAGSGGCAPKSPSPIPTPPPRNLLLIVVDTLRQDELGVYGMPRATSPHLDALAARSTTFANAYTVSPWTLPSMASILTGLYPQRHGVTSFRASVPPGAVTLAEILRDEDFITAAVVSNVLMHERYGMSRGFQSYDTQHARGHHNISTQGVTGVASSLIRRIVADGRRFFLLVHYFDPHVVYHRHPEFAFSAERAGRLEGSDRVLRIREILDDITEEEVRFLRDSYDEEVRFTDEGIGTLLDALREHGVEDETLVVVTSDHGEEFYGHGWIGHTNSLYDDVMRVPLLVHDPRTPRAAVVSRPASVVGIPPTVLDLLQVSTGNADFQGESFATGVTGDVAGWSEEMFLEVDFQGEGEAKRLKTAFKKGLVTDDRKIVRDDSTGAVELFDLRADPLELDDRAAADPELTERLAERLEARLAEAAEDRLEPGEVVASPADLEKLRALGYVGN